MARHDALRPLRAARGLPDRTTFVAMLLLAVALVCLSLGGTLLGSHWQGERVAYRAAAGLAIAGLSLVQLLVALRVGRGLVCLHAETMLRGRLFWRALLVAVVISYVVGLCVGPEPGALYVFLAATIGLYTLLLLPLVVDARRWPRWAALRQMRGVRRAGRVAFAAAIGFVAAELGLRALDVALDDQLAVNYTAEKLRLSPGSEFRGRTVNEQGYWDDDFQAARSHGACRIAVLGDRMTLSGDASTNFLAQLERQLPGVEVYHFGIPQAGPRDYAAQVAHEVIGYQPDLVLTFVTVGDDITDQTRSTSAFDWKSLRVARWSAHWLGTPTPYRPVVAQAALAPASYEDYLDRIAPRLAVCRTPIDQRMRVCWHDTTRHLDRLAERCQRAGLPMALVVVPDEYQVSPRLCAALSRRVGCNTQQLDLDLPQRRLKRYAQTRDLPLLDLLPYFRAEGQSAWRRHTDDWNEAGQQLAGSVVADWLQARYGLLIAQRANLQTAGSAVAAIERR